MAIGLIFPRTTVPVRLNYQGSVKHHSRGFHPSFAINYTIWLLERDALRVATIVLIGNGMVLSIVLSSKNCPTVKFYRIMTINKQWLFLLMSFLLFILKWLIFIYLFPIVFFFFLTSGVIMIIIKIISFSLLFESFSWYYTCRTALSNISESMKCQEFPLIIFLVPTSGLHMIPLQSRFFLV